MDPSLGPGVVWSLGIGGHKALCIPGRYGEIGSSVRARACGRTSWICQTPSCPQCERKLEAELSLVFSAGSSAASCRPGAKRGRR